MGAVVPQFGVPKLLYEMGLIVMIFFVPPLLV